MKCEIFLLDWLSFYQYLLSRIDWYNVNAIRTQLQLLFLLLGRKYMWQSIAWYQFFINLPVFCFVEFFRREEAVKVKCTQ